MLIKNGINKFPLIYIVFFGCLFLSEHYNKGKNLHINDCF